MSEGEPTGTHMSRLTKTVVSVVIGLGVFLSLRDLPENQAHVAGVFACVVALWVSEALPHSISALLGAVGLILFADVPEKSAFASFGSPIVLLFIGSFTLARAFEVNGVHERIASWILSRRVATRSPSALLLTFGAMCVVFSLFLSNTATTALMLPIAAGVLVQIGKDGPNSKYATAMVLMLAWGSSFAVGTPVATPPNLIGLGFLQESGYEISFGQWMAFGLPIDATMLLIGWGILCLLYLRKDRFELPKLTLDRATPLSSAARNTVVVFFLTLVLWLLPDATALILGGESNIASFVKEHLTTAVAALLGACLCYILPAKGSETGRTLTWKEGSQIQWGTILLFGGGLALGDAMASSGLTTTIGSALQGLVGNGSVWAVVALAIVVTIVLSELASNTAAVTALVPVVFGLATAVGASPVAPVLACTLAGSYGLMLPVSTPPNAIVHGSGMVTTRQMMRAGVFIDLIALFVVYFWLRVMLPVLGLA